MTEPIPAPKETPEVPTFESLHAYLMLSNIWAPPAVTDAGALRYSCLHRGHAPQSVVVPLHVDVAPDAVQKLVAQIAELEARTEAKLRADLSRVRSLEAVRSGPFDDLREGATDPEFNVRIRAIILQTPTFIVYLRDDLEIVWNNSADYGAFPDDFGIAMNRFATLEAQPIEFLGFHYREKYRRLLAEGVARLLDDKAIGNAMAVFDVAAGYLRDRGKEKARRAYLSAGLVLVPVAIALAGALWTHRGVADAVMMPGFTLAAMSGCVGAVGAFLSVYYRISEVDIDASGGSWGLVTEGAIRILVGAAAATLVGWAIRADFLMGFMKGLTDTPSSRLLIGALAGASERLVPMLVTTFDERATPSAATLKEHHGADNHADAFPAKEGQPTNGKGTAAQSLPPPSASAGR